MHDPPIIVAARTFLALLGQPQPLCAAKLANALDHVAAASHAVPRGSSAKRRLRPPADVFCYGRRRDRDPGHYVVVDPLGRIDQTPYLGSMADDLLDLGNAMADLVWRFGTHGESDAHFFIRSHQFHWEWHLRDLAFYLFNIRFRQSSAVP